MKSLLTIARNIRHTIYDGQAVPEIEIVLSVSEKESTFVGGHVVAAEACETYRFACDQKGARSMAEYILKAADDAEKEAESITVEKDHPKQT